MKLFDSAKKSDEKFSCRVESITEGIMIILNQGSRSVLMVISEADAKTLHNRICYERKRFKKRKTTDAMSIVNGRGKESFI